MLQKTENGIDVGHLLMTHENGAESAVLLQHYSNKPFHMHYTAQDAAAAMNDGRKRVFYPACLNELPEEGWQARSGTVCAQAVSNHMSHLATSGDTTLKLWLREKAAGAAREEMLSFSTCFPAAWLHFGRDADGSDRSLLHAQPFCPLEIWLGDTAKQKSGS